MRSQKSRVGVGGSGVGIIATGLGYKGCRRDGSRARLHAVVLKVGGNQKIVRGSDVSRTRKEDGSTTGTERNQKKSIKSG